MYTLFRKDIFYFLCVIMTLVKRAVFAAVEFTINEEQSVKLF